MASTAPFFLPPEVIQGPFLYQTLLPSFRSRTDDLGKTNTGGPTLFPRNTRRSTPFLDSMSTFGALLMYHKGGYNIWRVFPREGDGEIPHVHELANDQGDSTWRTRERDVIVQRGQLYNQDLQRPQHPEAS